MKKWQGIACCAVVQLLVVIAVFAVARTGYEFYYSDAPRHALNGAFILDMVRDFPIRDPVQWAYNYYAQYPALTILFYPPLYPALLAMVYAVSGVSQASAVFTNALFYLALLMGSYRLGRRSLGAGGALIATALVGVLPEIAFWGRQVMTDVPATAMLVWSVAMFLDYRAERSGGQLYASGLFVLAAVWLKLTMCFLLPVLALSVLIVDGRHIWRSPRHWGVLMLGVVGLLPLIWLTLHFGQTNMQSVAHVPDGQASRLSLANWLWYPRRLPGMIGWPLCVGDLLALFVGGSVLLRRRRLGAEWLFLIAWVAVGYLFFSVVDLKDPRFVIPVLPPLALIAVRGLQHLLAPSWRVGAHGMALVLAATTLVITWAAHPPLYVGGYARVVRDVAREAPPNSNVVFSGYRDGAFIFAMRAIGHRPDLHTLRADKLLLSVAIRRSAGVTQKHLSEAQIGQELTREKAAYVVAQDGFWVDLLEMRRLQNVLHSSQFKPVAHYRLPSNFPASDRSITVYRNLAKLPAKRPQTTIDLPAIGHVVTPD